METTNLRFLTPRTTVEDDHNPSMPPRNPWLADSAYPISRDNAAATDSVSHAGPTRGRKLSPRDVKTIPTVFTSNPTLKKVGDETIIFAAGLDGIRKINGTGQSFEVVSFLPYPGYETLGEHSRPEKIQAVLEKVNAARRMNDDERILELSREMGHLGFNRSNLPNGIHNLIDRDGFHYAAFGGLKIIKTSDGNDPNKPLTTVKVKDFSDDLPAGFAKSMIVGLGMTYDGNIVAAAVGFLFICDRSLNLKGILPFPGETVKNSFCMDEQGIYVVTSRRMLKIVWTGTKLSFDEGDGGWQSEYPESQYPAMGYQRTSSTSASTHSSQFGTTPTLMGFGDDPDKLVILSQGNKHGAKLVAFWRDQIPVGFKSKSGVKSARIADYIQTDISRVAPEPSPAVLGYGVVLTDNFYPKAVPDIWGNAMTAGVTRPAPMGATKLTWNVRTRSFEKTWSNKEVDNSDLMVPVISAGSGMIYLASKQNGDYQYLGLDWATGEIKARWLFPDDSRKWNGYGGMTVLLEDGDLLVGGFFAIKRLKVGRMNEATEPDGTRSAKIYSIREHIEEKKRRDEETEYPEIPCVA